MLKGCSVSPRVVPLNVDLGGRAVEVSAANPPAYRIDGLLTVPTPRTRAREEQVAFSVEVCQQHCERYYPLPQTLEIWRDQPFCFLGVTR